MKTKKKCSIYLREDPRYQLLKNRLFALSVLEHINKAHYRALYDKRYAHTAHTFSRLLSDVLIWERSYFYKQCISEDWQQYFLGGLSCWFNNIATETIDNVCKIPCLLFHFLLLMWTTLNIKVPLILKVDRKWKGRAWDNYKSTLNIEFEQDWSFTLGAALGDR